MRLTDLLGARLFDRVGTDLGKVLDVWLVQDGPPIGPFGAALRVDRLVAGTLGLGSRLGYERPSVTGPWPLAWYFHRRNAGRVAPSWSDVAVIEERRVRLGVAADALERPRSIQDHHETSAARVVSAGLDLLDRQLVDHRGYMAGKVDDLELEGREQGPAVVTAILAGPGALASRVGGRPGAGLASVHERLRPRDREGPARVSFGVVAGVADHVDLTVGREDLDTYVFERWVRERIIEKIPGS
jgi:sporulation protein YlmC with PRC-barrel domain